MRNAINGLLHDANQGPACRVVSRSAGRRQAVDYFSFDEVALKIGSDVVDASNIATLAGSVGKETARGMMRQCLGEGLIVVDSGLEGAALHAEASLRRAVALEFENPYEFVHASTVGHF